MEMADWGNDALRSSAHPMGFFIFHHEGHEEHEEIHIKTFTYLISPDFQPRNESGNFRTIAFMVFWFLPTTNMLPGRKRDKVPSNPANPARGRGATKTRGCLKPAESFPSHRTYATVVWRQPTLGHFFGYLS